METSSFTGLINNAALLLAMGVVYDSLGLQNIQRRYLRDAISGILIGFLGMGLMLTPWEMTPGVFFDTRWILISICGLYFGPIPTLIAVCMTVSLRLHQGGAGIMVGSLVIIFSAAIGLTWRYLCDRYKQPLNWWRLYMMGMLVQLTVLSLMLLMPVEMRYKIIAAIAPTLLTAYPIGTMVLGLILGRQQDRRKAEQDLIKSRRTLNYERGLLRGLIDALPSHIYIKNIEGKYLGCNTAFQNYVNLPEKEIIGKTDYDLFEQEKAFQHSQLDDKTTSKLIAHTEECWVESGKNNEPILFETLRTPFHDMDGNLQGLVGVSRNITERRQTEEHIMTLSQAIEQSPVSVVITSPEGDIEYVNSAFEKITGYSQKEILGQNSRILKSGRTPQGRYSDLWHALSSGQAWTGEFQNQRKNGEIFWEQAHIAPVMDTMGNIKHFLAVKQDITQQKEQEEKILHQAHFDSLTQLPNRFLSMDRLEQLLHESDRNQYQVAVLFLDLDDFKKVNDTLGHETGDKLLIEAANRLKGCIREVDTVGRLGGDEFIVLLNNLETPADTQPVANKILERFRESLKVEGRDILLTISIGISIYPNDGDNPAELLRNADSAMYYSKAQGRNSCHYFTEEMNQGAEQRLLLEEQLHNALSRNEFHLLYQPVIDLQSKKIVGAEALLRWNSQQLGMVYPDRFIPVAEQTGLIVPIGYYVLREAITQAKHWQQNLMPDFKIAVNLSPRQFRDAKLVDTIEQHLQQLKMPGSLLDLEITEGVLMTQQSDVDIALDKLSALDISVSMDDFGTGYSSLSYLRSYPFDILKIDKSFVNDITVDSGDMELVNATIDMAHGLGLKVIAEGVETKEQMQLLKARGCEFAQGYYFSKPVSAEVLETLLEKQNRVESMQVKLSQ